MKKEAANSWFETKREELEVTPRTGPLIGFEAGWDAALTAERERSKGLLEALKYYAETSEKDEAVCLNGARDSRFGHIRFDDFSNFQLRADYVVECHGKRARLAITDYEKETT